MRLDIGARSIPFQGQLGGMVECAEGECTFSVELHASGAGGAKLECLQQGVVDAADFVVWRKNSLSSCELLLGFGL